VRDTRLGWLREPEIEGATEFGLEGCWSVDLWMPLVVAELEGREETASAVGTNLCCWLLTRAPCPKINVLKENLLKKIFYHEN